MCASLSPKWPQPISLLLKQTGLADTNVAALAARYGPNQFIVEIPTFTEVMSPTPPFFIYFYNRLRVELLSACQGACAGTFLRVSDDVLRAVVI